MIKVKQLGNSTVIGMNIDDVRYFVVSKPNLDEIETTRMLIGSIFSVQIEEIEGNVSPLFHNILMTKIKGVLKENGYLFSLDEEYYKRCMLCGMNYTENDIAEGKHGKLCCQRSSYVLPSWISIQNWYIQNPIYFKEV